VEKLDLWIDALLPSQWALDLGCGAGSFPNRFIEKNVIGVDVAPAELTRTSDIRPVCARAEKLPFPDSTFELVICHHSLEHVADVGNTLSEIRRVMTPTARLYISVPDGYSFSDRLYRLLLCGGGHLQQFTYDSVRSQVKWQTGLELAASRELYSSFVFIEKKNFTEAPHSRAATALPRRMRWIGRFPSWSFWLAKITLNLLARLVDKLCATHLARYGWEFAFQHQAGPLEIEAVWSNVCAFCGVGVPRSHIRVLYGILYRCERCSSWNIAY
jgi:SAM-dependent methyltransferase